jgi:hypothetical protein
MRRVGHRSASETRCRFAADAAVAPPAVTLNRTIATCCQAVARQTQAQPARSPLRPPKAECPNTHSSRGTATARSPADSFPAGFRTPAPSTCGIVREGRHPEPSTDSVLRRCPRYVRLAPDSVHESGHRGTSLPCLHSRRYFNKNTPCYLAKKSALKLKRFSAPKAAHKTAIYRSPRSVYRQYYQSAALMPSAGKQSR